MTLLKLLTVVGASLFPLAKASGQGVTTTYSVKLSDKGQCITEINAAREDVGLSSFVELSSGDGKGFPAEVDGTQPEALKNSAWAPVCQVLLPKTSSEQEPSTLENFGDGTYAFKVLESATPACSKTVSEWKAAYKSFNGPPPPYSKNKELYSNPDTVSFVAIYNPSPGAAADCRVVTCTRKSTAVKANTDNTETTENGYALICMTTPDVLPEDGDTAPFSEAQWAQIATVLKGSSSAVLPSVLGLAAAALGVAISML